MQFVASAGSPKLSAGIPIDTRLVFRKVQDQPLSCRTAGPVRARGAAAHSGRARGNRSDLSSGGVGLR